MIRRDLVKYVLKNIWNRKLRSFLTIISVVIGIAAIIALVSFGQGISSYVEDIAKQMGDDKLLVQPRGFGFGPSVDSNIKLDDSDVEAIESVSSIAEASGVYMLSVEVVSHDQRRFAQAFGMDYENHENLINEVYDLELVAGKKLRGTEKSKAIFGYNHQIPDKIFEKSLKLGDKVKINNHTIEVSGFYESLGNPIDDANIYMTHDAAEDIFSARNFQFIMVRTIPGESPSRAVQQVKKALLNHRNQKSGSEDFFVETFEQVIASFTSVLAIVTTVVILIALISLIVASVNITNTMYTSILERTNELGVFKAVGARNSDIMGVVVLESGLLSLLGGIIGMVIGIAVASAAGKIIASAGYAAFSPLVTWQLVSGALLFSLIIGIVAGIFPAYQASKLKPVDALRYE